MSALQRLVLTLGFLPVAIACRDSAAPPAEAPERSSPPPPSSSSPQPWPGTRAPLAPSTAPLPERTPGPSRREQPPVADAPVPQTPLPEPGVGLSLREAYERTEAELVSLSRLLGDKNREVVARYGRNDTPEGLRILTPIRDRLQQARHHLDHLTCRDQPVGNVRQELERRRIPLGRHRVDSRWVDAYIDAKVRDGDISTTGADDLRFVLSKSGRGVMNPSSLGAHTINQRVVQALACFGLTGPARSRMRLPPEPPPPPKPTVTSRFRFFRTCGDAVCRSYRGPTPGVPTCGSEREGAPCSQPGARCDLANNCNMHLICTDQDPATRCPR